MSGSVTHILGSASAMNEIGTLLRYPPLKGLVPSHPHLDLVK